LLYQNRTCFIWKNKGLQHETAAVSRQGLPSAAPVLQQSSLTQKP